MPIPIAYTAIWRAHKKEHLLGMELTQGLIGFAGGEPMFVGDEMQGPLVFLAALPSRMPPLLNAH
ncbi:hypothetical protein [Halioxenophilus aromaticivorans]|uniref:Uncharacterized protein n=1 Tax=Halioxenophilus aromaticivorans TaxID=1306992 RepID=A0AAV3U2S9_9ALTE